MLKSFDVLSATLTLLAVITIVAVQTKPNIEMIFDVCDCNSSDPDGYLSNLSCFVGKNAKRRTFSITWQYKKPVNKFNVNFRVELPREPQNFVIFNLTNIDGCQLLMNRNQITFVHVAVASLGRYSNLPKHCPLKKSVPYYIRGFRMDMNLLPALTFETTMNFHYDLTIKKNKIISGFIQAHTVVKKTKGRLGL